MADYSLEWSGRKVELKEARAWEYADAVEDVAPMGRLVGWMTNPADMPFGRVSEAISALYAVEGVKIDPRDLRKELVASMRDDGSGIAIAVSAVQWLILVVNDGIWQLSDGEAKESTKGKKKKPA